MSDHPHKRTSERVPFVVRVSYPDRKALADASENLSVGGLFIQTREPFSLGEVVRLSLSFPGLLEPFELKGAVAWRRPPTQELEGGIGICVDDPEERARLIALLDGAANPRARQSGPFQVLLVEDNPHVAEMYSYTLRKLASQLPGSAVEVHFASDGHQALQVMQEQAIQLVITDLYMPVLDGFALVERLRALEATKNVPIVAISAGGPEARTRALSAGVDVFLRKPVRFVEVLETVKTLIGV
jgi:uncharacterized protein (TIGR02266 family)